LDSAKISGIFVFHRVDYCSNAFQVKWNLLIDVHKTLNREANSEKIVNCKSVHILPRLW